MVAIALGEAPKLKELYLSDVFIRPPYAHQLPSLRALTLRSFRGTISALVMYDLLALLSTCPTLEYLKLKAHGFKSRAYDVKAGAISRPVLSNLKRLILEDDLGSRVDILLWYASMENLTYFKYSGHGTTPFQSLHHRLPHAVLPILARNTDQEVVLRIHRTRVDLKLEGRVHISFAHSSVEEIRLLGMGLQLDKVDVTLTFSVLWTGWLASISLLSPQVLNIRTIRIYLRRKCPVKPILELILTPDAAGKSLPFAALERIVVVGLILAWPPFFDDIKALLQARNQFAEECPGLEARDITLDWECNGDIVHNEEAGTFTWG